MQSFKQHTRRVALAVVALGLGGLAPSAFAATIDTNFDTTVVNRASVNYSVSGVPQTVIRSAPGAGNSTPGAGGGSDTTFKVDKKLMFLAEETNSAATVTSPGLNNVVAVFRVTNNSNGAQDFQLNPSNPTAPPAIPSRRRRLMPLPPSRSVAAAVSALSPSPACGRGSSSTTCSTTALPAVISAAATSASPPPRVTPNTWVEAPRA